MQPRALLIGTYGCGRRHQPASTGGQHGSSPQPRVVDRAARGGARRLGHGRRSRRRDRPPPWRAAARRRAARSPAARAKSGTVTGAQSVAVTSTQPGTVTSTQPRGVTSTQPRGVTGTRGVTHLADARAETVTQRNADLGAFARTRPIPQSFAQAGTQVAREGSHQRGEPRRVH
jgi:hypothetical protein